MKKIIITLALALTSVATIQAQTIKLGYINADELVSLMPEYEKASDSMGKFSKTYEDQIKKLETDRDARIADYEKNSKNFDATIKQLKEKEINDLMNRLEEFKYTAQEKLNSKKETLLAPILKKADDAIKLVAKENGYTYVFDALNSGLLHAPDNDNIMPLVLAKLNIKEKPAGTGIAQPKVAPKK
jgi:outer membrane protein